MLIQLDNLDNTSKKLVDLYKAARAARDSRRKDSVRFLPSPSPCSEALPARQQIRSPYRRRPTAPLIFYLRQSLSALSMSDSTVTKISFSIIHGASTSFALRYMYTLPILRVVH